MLSLVGTAGTNHNKDSVTTAHHAWNTTGSARVAKTFPCIVPLGNLLHHTTLLVSYLSSMGGGRWGDIHYQRPWQQWEEQQ